MFAFIINVKEWINKNPFRGMNDKKIGVEKPKEVTQAQFNTQIEHPKVIKDEKIIELTFSCTIQVCALVNCSRLL